MCNVYMEEQAAASLERDVALGGALEVMSESVSRANLTTQIAASADCIKGGWLGWVCFGICCVIERRSC